MANQELATNDRERFEAARHRGNVRSEDPSAVVAGRYEAEADALRLQFRGGGVMMTEHMNVWQRTRYHYLSLVHDYAAPRGFRTWLSAFWWEVWS